MAKPCRYQLPGTDTWMSESEFKKALNDGLIDKHINDGVIAIRNFKPKAVTTPVEAQPVVEPTKTKKDLDKEFNSLNKKYVNDSKLLDEATKNNQDITEIENRMNETQTKMGEISNQLESLSESTKETPKAEPVVKSPEAKKESALDEELSSAIINMENIEEEIAIEKDNIREEKQRIKEEKAKVRASKMPKDQKQEKLEDLDVELEEYIENAEASIEYYQMDLKAAKSEVKKLENRKAKEQATQEAPKAEPAKTEKQPVVKEQKAEYKPKPKAEKLQAPGITKQAFDRNFTVEMSEDGTMATVQGEPIQTADGRTLTPPKETVKITTNTRGERVAVTSKGETVYLDKAKPVEAKEVKTEGKTRSEIEKEHLQLAKESNGGYAIVYSRTNEPLVFKLNKVTGRWQELNSKGEWVNANDNRNDQANDAVNYTRKDRKMVKMSTVKNGVTSVEDFVFDFNDNTWKKLNEDGFLYGVGKELSAQAEKRFVLENPKRAPKTKEEIKQRISDVIDGLKPENGIIMSSIIPGLSPKLLNKILDLVKESMLKGVDFSFAINDAAKKVFSEAVKNKEITKQKSKEYIDAINNNIYNDDIPEFTAIKKELTSDLAREIAKRGFSNMKAKELFDLAEKEIKSGNIDPDVLARDIQQSPRPITNFETAILLYAKTSASVEFTELNDKSKTTDKNSEAYKAIDAKMRILNDKMLMYDVSGLMGGSLNASSLSIRRYVMNAEYDLILPQIERIYSENDQEMPEGLAEKIKEGLKELRKIEREIEKLKTEAELLKEDEALKNIAEAAKKPSKGKYDTNKKMTSNDGKITVSQESIRNAVINGATEIEQVVDAVRDEVLASFPNATDRQIRDAISNYGMEVKKSSDEITQEINRIKGVGRMISQLEDIEQQLKSGKGKFLNSKLKDSAKRILTQRQNELRRAIKEAMAKIPVTDEQFEDFKKYKLEAYKKRLADRTTELKEKIKNKDFASKSQSRIFELDEEARNLEEEKRKIVDEFEYEKVKAELAIESKFKKIGRTFIDALSLPRGLTASFDVSAPLRQGIVLLSTQNPLTSKNQIGKMLYFFAKPGSYEKWLTELKASKEYSLFKDSKLFISEQSPKLEAKEEMFASNLANKIPILGEKLIPGKDIKGLQAYKRSEYAYAGFLNMMRVETFMQGVQALREQGYTFESNPEVYKDWAKYVNSATGRGNLNVGNQVISAGLSATFFSPSLIKARLQILGLSPGYYAKLSPAVRAMAVKRTLSFMGMMSTFLGLTALLLSLNDDDDEDKNRVELDPRSSDFGKIIKGDTRIDLTGGTAIYYRTLAQFFSMAKKNMSTKQIEQLGQKYGDETSVDVLEKFFANKLSPFAASVYKKYGLTQYEKEKREFEQESKDNVFNRIGVPLLIQNLTVPMWMNDAEEIIKSNGAPIGTILVGASLFGAGVQVIKPKFKASSNTISDFSDIQDFDTFEDPLSQSGNKLPF